MTYIVIAYTVMAYTVMACTVMAYIVMAYIVMFYIVMVDRPHHHRNTNVESVSRSPLICTRTRTGAHARTHARTHAHTQFVDFRNVR